jgi:hypothetical protein
LQRNPDNEFAKVVAFFGGDFDESKFDRCNMKISKEEIKHKTIHDPQVINLSRKYELTREQFKDAHGEFVWSVLLQDREHLLAYFE